MEAGEVPSRYLRDATEVRGLAGEADAIVRPSSTTELAALMTWCDEHDVPVTPRGGGTGYAGGAVPHGGIVCSTERLSAIHEFEPFLWRGRFGAGVITSTVQRLARENGLLYPPDPGAAESSQLGGNVATNAGGPHSFKYGVTRAWVTGLEAVTMPGEVIKVGGAARKDVGGYDLQSLLVGSEGTLAVISAIAVRFIPAPEASYPIVGCYASAGAAADAVLACLGSGITPAAIEFLDEAAVDVVRPGFPWDLDRSGLIVIAEADGSAGEARAGRDALLEAMSPGTFSLFGPEEPAEVRALWRWRDGVGLAADAKRGGKVSEDIVVPVDRLAEAMNRGRDIATRFNLDYCCWGHAGDGNLHATFMFDRLDFAAANRSAEAASELFAMAVDLGGGISGEHGIGSVKNGQLRRQWDAPALDLHRGIKRLFDPKGLLNPDKKLA
ncbi:MAG: FAD-binding oxidoreductase [Solirubrobacterales bacterium]